MNLGVNLGVNSSGVQDRLHGTASPSYPLSPSAASNITALLPQLPPSRFAPPPPQQPQSPTHSFGLQQDLGQPIHQQPQQQQPHPHAFGLQRELGKQQAPSSPQATLPAPGHPGSVTAGVTAGSGTATAGTTAGGDASTPTPVPRPRPLAVQAHHAQQQGPQLQFGGGW